MAYNIGRFAQKAGLSASTVRYYEKEGLIPVPVRRAGARIYEDADLHMLRLVVAAREAGFRIAEIREFLNETKTSSTLRLRLVAAASMRAEKIENTIQLLQIQQSKLANVTSCRCDDLGNCTIFSQLGG